MALYAGPRHSGRPDEYTEPFSCVSSGVHYECGAEGKPPSTQSVTVVMSQSLDTIRSTCDQLTPQTCRMSFERESGGSCKSIVLEVVDRSFHAETMLIGTAHIAVALCSFCMHSM